MRPPFKIPSFSIILIFICLALLGIALVPLLPIRLAPTQVLPQISISFSMQGSSPRIVESEATSKLESVLSSVKGIKEISSISANGRGTITLRLDRYADIDIARFEISAIIRQTWPLLKGNVSYPSISMNHSDKAAVKPFLTYTIIAPSSPGLIQKYAERHIKNKLSQTEGINRINISGASPSEWLLEYDYKYLEAIGVSTNDIKEAISNQLGGEFIGIGAIETIQNEKRWIRIALNHENEENRFTDIENIEVIKINNRTFRLKDLVRIEKREATPQSYFRINGANAIYMSIIADQNANQIKLGKTIREKLAAIEPSLPNGYQLHLSYDATEYIQNELDKIYFRSGLTLLILLLFVLFIYRSLRYTLLIIISLFINLTISILFYYFFRLEIQLYSMAGITISLTLIIDNIIVMADQIIRKNNLRSFLSILAATTTTVASLSIIFFLDEKTKLNLLDFACVIIINLSVSLFIALFLVPSLIEKLKIDPRPFRLPRHTKEDSGCSANRQTITRRRIIRFSRFYSRLCQWIGKRKTIVVTIILLSFGLPVFLLPEKTTGDQIWDKIYNKTIGTKTYKEKISPYTDIALGGTLRLFIRKVFPNSHFEERQQTTLNITATLPANATMTQMNEQIIKMEKYISGFPEVFLFQTSIYEARQANITIFFTPKSEKGNFPYTLKAKLIKKAKQTGGGSWQISGAGKGFSNEYNQETGSYRIKMYGFNYDELYFWAGKFRDRLSQYRRIKDITINSEFNDYKDDYEELRFNIDKERLAQENILPAQLFGAMNTAFAPNVTIAQLLSENGPEEVKLQSRRAQDYDIWSLNHIPYRIKNRDFKLCDLVTIGKATAPQKIVRINQQYRLCLQYNYVGTWEQGKIVSDENIRSFRKELPMGYSIYRENLPSQKNNSNGRQFQLLLIILIIIYFISSILFNSLLQPLHIISIIPISFIGIFLTFYLFRINFDQGGFASFILLSGITINASIYIIDEYNNIRKKRPGINLLDAYIKAWNSKIKPIFLTITSTVLGFIPFIIGQYKEDFWFPLAAGTIGGLIISLIAIFLFLPLAMGISSSSASAGRRTPSTRNHRNCLPSCQSRTEHL